MNTSSKLQSLLCLCTLLCFAGCGEPKWKSGFEEFLKKKSLADNMPFDVANVKTEVVTSSDKETTFRFTADFVLRESIYLNVPNSETGIDSGLILEAQQKAAALPLDVQSQLAGLLQQSSDPKILKLSAKKGDVAKFAGAAIAEYDGAEWSYKLTDIHSTDAQSLDGDSAPTDQKWFLAGSPEANAAIERKNKEISQFVKAVAERISEIEAGKQATEEQEQARRIELSNSFAKTFAVGAVFAGQWSNARSAGKIAFAITTRDESGKAFPFTGYFFDPDKPEEQKPFTGSPIGSGAPNNPYGLKLNAIAGKGLDDKLFNQGTRWTSLNLLLANQGFGLTLIYDPATQEFSGVTSSVRQWGGADFRFKSSSH